MGRNWRELFGFGPPETDSVEVEPEFEPIEIILPGNIQGHGKFDENSPTWLFIKNWAQENLDKIRKNNDIIGTSMEKTEANRGRIDILKKLINIPGK